MISMRISLILDRLEEVIKLNTESKVDTNLKKHQSKIRTS